MSEVTEIKTITFPSNSPNLSLDERVEIVKNSVRTEWKRNYDNNLSGNPYSVGGNPPEEVLRLGMHNYYEQLMEE